jgi:hypothetical protein
MLGLSANFTQTVLMYLCICICVFARQTPGNIVFEVLASLPFGKIYGLYGPKPCTMEKSWDVTPVTD